MPIHNSVRPPSREQLIHELYEAAELEHTLMCTYLYAAFSLKSGQGELENPEEAERVAGWRRVILQVAVEEMGHLTAVWNITSALGGTPRFGRGNFPLDPGALPAGIVVKLAPFSPAVLQHFVHLERPQASNEPEGQGFAPELMFQRGIAAPRLTPMAADYETVGAFYECLGQNLRAFVADRGEAAAFCGDPALQLSASEVELVAAKPVICSKTALAAFAAIVEQGEGAPLHSAGSHFHKFLGIRGELEVLSGKNPKFAPAFPAAHNPVLRPPLRRQGRIWIENEDAAKTVDLANAAYALMLRLLAYSYLVPRPSPEKSWAIDLGIELMRAVTHLGERAARLPVGPSNPDCHAGMSFTALRDASPLPPGPASQRFFRERLFELLEAAKNLAEDGEPRAVRALRVIEDLTRRSAKAFEAVTSAPSSAAPPPAPLAPIPTVIDGVEEIEGQKLTLVYEGKRCIHARFCVTGAPAVFLANVQGPWIHPDATAVERLVEIAHACPSGAIRYRRKDGGTEETAPPVNLLAIREAGPYAVRGDLRVDGVKNGFRATLCRCGASKNKPYCDGSHHEVGFAASGEPPSGKTDMLELRDGPLAITPQVDGPLQVRGNLEITSGTGRVVARLVQARLCRCGGSSNKPFCDGTHERIGFRST